MLSYSLRMRANRFSTTMVATALEILVGEKIRVNLAIAEEATFHPISSDVPKVPCFYIARSGIAGYRGIKSGGRSAWIALTGLPLPVKYKGADIEKALKGRGPYRIPHGASPWEFLEVKIVHRVRELRLLFGRVRTLMALGASRFLGAIPLAECAIVHATICDCRYRVLGPDFFLTSL